MPSGLTRRTFLGLAAALVGVMLALPGVAAGDRQMHWAMGTLWEIDTPGVRDHLAVEGAFAEIRRLDALLSHYQPPSAVSRLNRAGHGHVPEELAALLRRCRALSVESHGAFDITVGPLVELWGFKDLAFHLPSPEAITRSRARIGWQRVQVVGRDVRLAPGTTIEFGAIGKGYALDQAMAVLRRAGIRRARIDAGGQQLVMGAWDLGIRHPRQAGVLGRFRLADGHSASTSGDDERGFTHAGKRFGHVLDPRTGWPSEHWPSVTVVAPSAEIADALSTIAMVEGPKAMPILKRHHAEALWYGQDGRVTPTPGFAWQPEAMAGTDRPNGVKPAP